MKNVLLFLLFFYPNVLISGPFTPVPIFSGKSSNNIIYMDRLTLRRIFTRQETRWSDGQSITVFIRHYHSLEHRIFLLNVLKMTPYRYITALESYTYTGKALEIEEVDSDYEMISKVNKYPGAIGYVDGTIFYNQKIIKVCEDHETCPNNIN